VTDLASVYVKRRDKFDITTAIAADRVAHDALGRHTLAIPIVFNPLNERASAIADTGDGYFNFLSHRHATFRLPTSRN
jgi:hypothetical protein